MNRTAENRGERDGFEKIRWIWFQQSRRNLEQGDRTKNRKIPQWDVCGAAVGKTSRFYRSLA